MRVRYWALLEILVGLFFILIADLLSELLLFMDLVFFTAGSFLMGWGFGILFTIKMYKLIRKT